MNAAVCNTAQLPLNVLTTTSSDDSNLFSVVSSQYYYYYYYYLAYIVRAKLHIEFHRVHLTLVQLLTAFWIQ